MRAALQAAIRPHRATARAAPTRSPAAQPLDFEARLDACRRSAAAASAGDGACCSSTSTASRRSTNPSATQPATRCCCESRPAPAPRWPARATRRRASAATSSCCCWPTPTLAGGRGRCGAASCSALVAGPASSTAGEVPGRARSASRCTPSTAPTPTLIAHADAAMRAAKRTGGSTYCLLRAAHGAATRATRSSCCATCASAIARGELELYYQPKVDAPQRRDHRRRGAGALAAPAARHRQPDGVHPDGRALRPDRRARRLGDRRGLPPDPRLARRTACACAWRSTCRCTSCARPTWSSASRGAEAAPHQPALLTCEITETVAMEDTEATMRSSRSSAAVGVHMSIDDFGTGYSSLAYLRKLPADELKIDRSFVLDLETSGDARAVVDAVVNLAQALGLQGGGRGRRDRAPARDPAHARLRRVAGLPVRQADVGHGAGAVGDERRRRRGRDRLPRLAVRADRCARAAWSP